MGGPWFTLHPTLALLLSGCLGMRLSP
jgi:hypothetical protein